MRYSERELQILRDALRRANETADWKQKKSRDQERLNKDLMTTSNALTHDLRSQLVRAYEVQRDLEKRLIVNQSTINDLQQVISAQAIEIDRLKMIIQEQDGMAVEATTLQEEADALRIELKECSAQRDQAMTLSNLGKGINYGK